jgi:ATP-binding cassette subfamily B (MDR/TAP) protein 1
VKAEEMDPKALSMWNEAEKIRKEDEAAIVKSLDYITNKKTASATFRKSLSKHTNCLIVILACLFIFFLGIICPLFGWYIMECMYRMNVA